MCVDRRRNLCLFTEFSLQAAQKDLRGEAIERNEAYEAFSAAC